MTAFRARGAGPLVNLTVTLSAQGSIVISSSTVFGTSARTLAGASGSGFGTVGTTSSAWTVNPPTFTQGSGQTFNVAATLPAGSLPGGVHDIDLAGTPLPSGMTHSAAGTLAVGTALPVNATGVVFEYTEPGAMPTLTLHPNATGTLPYVATLYPLEGVVPSGRAVISPNEPNLRSSTLSAWPDGSARVMVLAGETAVTNGVTRTIGLRVGVPSGVPLTTADIASKFTTGISVDFGTGVGTLNNWGSPDRIWWANSQVICARYRLAIPGKGDMEAVIDVHAFAGGQAWVEVVVENGKVNANLATVSFPATQNYTNATVSVNGTTIATVSSPTVDMTAPRSRNVSGLCYYHGGHTAFRAWYCSAKVVGGVVTPLTSAQQRAETFGIEVTHDDASMMAHPWFYRRAVPSAENLQTKYQQTYDTYEPWAFCRLRFPSFNEGGADEEIGLITATQADYVLTGNKFARRGVLETGIAPLSAALAYRHTDGSVPTRAQVVGKNTGAGTWPQTPGPVVVYGTPDKGYPRWGGDGRYTDGSHVPNIALVPFMCRPSPVFIELAQNEFLFHHTNYNSVDGSHSYDQPRSRGWRARNMATTIFLTPDAGTWNTGAENDATRKAGYRAALVNQINVSRNFMDQPWNLYKHITAASLTTTSEIDNNTTRPRIQAANYMHWLIALSWHSIANGKVLLGADQTMMEAAANQIMEFPLRWFNDTSDYRWRGVAYQSTVGIQSGTQVIPQYTSVIDEHYYDVAGTPPSGPGPWLNFGTDSYNWSEATPQTAAGQGLFYPEHAWYVLCCAVERGAPGAEAAWTKVYGASGNGGITNIATWLAGMANSRSYLNRFPRNK